MASLLLRGNAWGLVTDRRGAGLLPSQVDLVHPDRVAITTNGDGMRVIRIGGVEQNPSDVFHIKAFPWPGQLEGLSPIAYARESHRPRARRRTLRRPVLRWRRPTHRVPGNRPGHQAADRRRAAGPLANAGQRRRSVRPPRYRRARLRRQVPPAGHRPRRVAVHPDAEVQRLDHRTLLRHPTGHGGRRDGRTRGLLKPRNARRPKCLPAPCAPGCTASNGPCPACCHAPRRPGSTPGGLVRATLLDRYTPTSSASKPGG